MATDSDIKLTKFKSTVTVVTADFANSIFGGMYGSSDADSMDDDDPRVLGHVHDGQRGDGHAQLINLVHHVTSQLTNPNLGDDAVTKRNVLDSTQINETIPEYRTDPDTGEVYYYLDLRHLRADLVFQEDEDPAGDTTQHRVIRQKKETWDGEVYVPIPDVWKTDDGFDYVFGSSSLDDLDLPDGDGDSRFQFDKSKSAFRAGRVTSDEWDNSKRGFYSVAMGKDTEASGQASTVSGGTGNLATGSRSTVSGGGDCQALADDATVGGGFEAKAHSLGSTVAGGGKNEAFEEYSTVAGGQLNHALGSHSSVGGGNDNKATGKGSVISGGESHKIKSSKDYGTIGGGFNNEIDGEHSTVSGGGPNYITGNTGTIGGGVSNEITAETGTIGGGEGNIITGKSASVLGGTMNWIKSDYGVNVAGASCEILTDSPYSLIAGGYKNVVDGDHSTIVGASDSWIQDGSHSSIYSGRRSTIKDSDGSIIVGHGKGKETDSISDTLSIGVGEPRFVSVTGGAVGDSPSDYSGIFGGYSNHIVGGEKDTENNFIIGGCKNRVGAIEHTVHSAQIFGGFNNEIVGFGSQGPLGTTTHALIFGGIDNLVITDQHSSDVILSGIIGGGLNGINQVPHSFGDTIAPWVTTAFTFGHATQGVQSSYIFGGIKNSIANIYSGPGVAHSFDKNSLYSAILGGHSNVITSSYGSSILGGGSFVDMRGTDIPPYNMRNVGFSPYPGVSDSGFRYYSNVVDGAHHSAILNGSSNLIRGYQFPVGRYGAHWTDPAKPDLEGTPQPLFCIAQGRESYSYLYGQNAYASGGHSMYKFGAQEFPPASTAHYPPIAPWTDPDEARYKVMLGSPWNDSTKSTFDQPGTAQASTLTFYGSWNYKQAEIVADPDGDGSQHWYPDITAPHWSGRADFEFRAHLDGGYDGISYTGNDPNRFFIPRYPASYQVTLNGTISYTDMNEQHGGYGSAEIGWHDTISFTYVGYIVLQADGSGKYGGSLTHYMASDPTVTLALFDPASPTGLVPSRDFGIAFCPDWDNRTGTRTNPKTAYEDNDGAPGVRGRGSWLDPAVAFDGGWMGGDTAWPPKFMIYVVNNSGDHGSLPLSGHPGNIPGSQGTGREFIGESIVVRADIAENLLFLGNYGDTDVSQP